MNLGDLTVYLKANMKGLTDGFVKAGQEVQKSTAQWQKNLNSSEASIKAFSEKSGREIQSFAKKWALVGAAIEATYLIYIKKQGDFEKALKKATSFTNVSDAQFGQMSKVSKAAALEFNLASKDTVTAFEALAKEIPNASEQLAKFNSVIAISKATGSSYNVIVDNLTDILGMFGDDLSQFDRYANVLAMTANKSNVSFDEMLNGISLVAVEAKNSGLSIEQLSAIIGLMAENGLSGSRALMSFQQTMQKLQNPTAEVNYILGKLGVNIYDANGAMIPFVQILENINSALANTDDETRNFAFNTLFAGKAIAGQKAIFNQGAGAIDKYADSLKNAGDYIGGINKKQLDNMNDQIGRLTISINQFFSKFSTQHNGAIKETASSLTEIVKQMNNWATANSGVVGTMGDIVGLLAVSATLVGGLIAGYIGLKIAASAAVIPMATIGSVFGVGVIAVAGLIAILGALSYPLIKSEGEFAKLSNSVNENKEAVKGAEKEFAKYLETLKKTEQGNRIINAQAEATKRLAENQAKLDKMDSGFMAKHAPFTKSVYESASQGFPAMTKQEIERQNLLANIKADQEFLKKAPELAGRSVATQNNEERKKSEILAINKELSDGMKSIDSEYINLKEGQRAQELFDLQNQYDDLKIKYRGHKDELAKIDQWYAENKRSIEAWGFEKYYRENRNLTEKYKESWTTAIYSVEGAMSNSIDDLMSGAKGWKDALESFALDVAASMRRAMADNISKTIMTGFSKMLSPEKAADLAVGATTQAGATSEAQKATQTQKGMLGGLGDILSGVGSMLGKMLSGLGSIMSGLASSITGLMGALFANTGASSANTAVSVFSQLAVAGATAWNPSSSGMSSGTTAAATGNTAAIPSVRPSGMKYSASLWEGGATPFAKGGIVKPIYAANGFVPKGTDTVPAMLTPGEMVLPKPMTDWLRTQFGSSGKPQSSGGSPININISAIDTQNAVQFLTRNKRVIAGAVQSAQSGNHPIRRGG